MKSSSKNDPVFNRLQDAITNYTLRNWEDVNSKLLVLKNFIQQTENIDVDINRLKKYILKIKRNLQHPLENTSSKAVLITDDRNIRIYKFGSDYCPKCSRFKNYKKSCPYCDYVEYTN
jgi:hypothetical protein